LIGIDNPAIIGLTVAPSGSYLKLKTKLKFLFIEPFFGGSHREFAEGLISHSQHHIDLLTLPARFWKWRMRGAALYFVKKITSLESYNGLITTDLMSLSDFKALSKGVCPPALVYFHENQLTYPLAPGEHTDYQFGFTDITTALCADKILFNSRAHHRAFFADLPGFIKMMPEYRPGWVVDEIRAKADVLYPGCRFPAKGFIDAASSREFPPLIIWNHRWEFDKNPDEFFHALDAALADGAEFRLALLGENFQAVPKAFMGARDRYGGRIVQYGFVESRQEYIKWLKRGSIVISTAQQENFGISVVEAIRHGCVPLLPDRLAYPEIIPPSFPSRVLYKDLNELVEKLTRVIKNYSGFQELRRDLSTQMGRFAWENIAGRYDEELEKLAHHY
jgi:glycosyltransferase involved in cell wall biosynthesis